jgi:hypothetical protein
MFRRGVKEVQSDLTDVDALPPAFCPLPRPGSFHFCNLHERFSHPVVY